MPKPLIPLAFIAALGACSASDPKISAGDGWARETGRAHTAAAYVTIQNKGGADELTGVRSSIGEATLHETSMEQGIMRMRPIEPSQGLSVPSNGKLVLAPGGAHVMVTGLKRPLVPGDRFGLTFLFGKSKPQRVVVTIKPATESRMDH